MSFADCLRSGRFGVALEITPPQRPLPAVLLRRARLLGETAQAINVIQRPNRQSSLDASIALRREGIEPVWHLATRGRARDELAADMAVAGAGGVQNVLCLRGEHAAPDLPETPSIRDAVAMARELMPGALIGATLNQYAPDGEAAFRNLLPKLRAGATYVQTQPVFDPGSLGPIVTRLRQASPATRVVAMAMPLLSIESLDRIEQRLSIHLPSAVRARIAAGEASAWALFRETVATLVSTGLADGVAIMTFEMDAPPGTGAAIVEALKAAGATG